MINKPILWLVLLLCPLVTMAQSTIFPAEHIAPAEFNTGIVHIQVLSHSQGQMTTNFLFERGSRNSWHYHPGATQVLMILDGEAYYQEEGKPKQLLGKGDVVTTAPGTRHWNGATPWSDAECLTITEIIPNEQHAIQLRKVTDQEFCSPVETSDSMIVRIAEIEVYPEYLTEYLSHATEVDRLSMEREPGVICLLPMQSEDDPTQIRIVEIYASHAAYQQHLLTEHFQRYKQGTLHMVKSLKLPTMQPLDTETMKLIFTKKRSL